MDRQILNQKYEQLLITLENPDWQKYERGSSFWIDQASFPENTCSEQASKTGRTQKVSCSDKW